MINIICVGKIKERYLSDLIMDYKMRISKYHKINIIEIKDSDIKLEGKEIIKYIGKNDYVISMAIEGELTDSVKLAKKIDDIFSHYSTIDFIIGGSYGLDESIKDISNYKLSLSRNTFPHGLFRGILLEQIYRCFKINNNETYHK